jgi:hypothetical protein
VFSTNKAEAFGYALVLGFLAFVWEPLPLLGGGLLIIVWANTRKEQSGRFTRAVATALGAGLAAAVGGWRAVADEDQDAVDDEPVDPAVAPAAGDGGTS